MKHAFTFLFCMSITGNTLLYSQNWQSLGNGTTHETRCIFSDTTNNLIYVGGVFAFADTVRVNGIGAWNGSTWIPVGQGDTMCTGVCPNPIVSINKLGNDIYAGGFFQSMGGVPNTTFAARWDGSGWNSLGTVNSQLGLKNLNNKIYAMGLYSFIGGISANSIASWDGIQWENVDSFPADPWGDVNVINSVENYQGDLYVGGAFDLLGNRVNITQWDGANWINLQNGVTGGLSYVSNILSFNNELYVGGSFKKTDGNAGNYLMVWNGYNWRDFSPNINYTGPIFDLKIIEGQLYILGAFSFTGDTTTYGLAKYDGNTFSAFGGANNWAYQIAGLNNELFVTTDDVIGTDTVHYVAKWIGGNQVDSTITVLAGIPKLSGNNNLTVYPNPFKEHLLVEFESPAADKVYISIFTPLGQCVNQVKKELKSGKNIIELDLSDLQSGLYFLKLTDGKFNLSEKFIKE